jgi:hypothetical protein
MSAFHSGAFVEWADGHGKVLNILGGNPDTHKMALHSPDAQVRIRVMHGTEPTDQIITKSVGELHMAQSDPRAAALAAHQAEPELEETLKATLSNLSETDRYALATSWFMANGPKLPRQVIGEEGRSAPREGIDRATGALDPIDPSVV